MGNMGSPTMGMANNSTGSLTPPPLGLFGVTNRLAAAGGPADRAFALGGGIFPPRTPTLGMSSLFCKIFFEFHSVLRIRIRRVHMFLSLSDLHPDPLVKDMNPDPDPSIMKQK